MRILNAAAAGMVAGLLLYLLVSLAAVKAAFFAFPVGWAGFALLFYLGAESVRKIWARACLAAAVECLIIPLASWILPFFYGQQAVQTAKQGAQTAGQAFGSAVGGGLVNVLAGYTGILIGFLLLVTAYFSLKPARRRR